MKNDNETYAAHFTLLKKCAKFISFEYAKIEINTSSRARCLASCDRLINMLELLRRNEQSIGVINLIEYQIEAITASRNFFKERSGKEIYEFNLIHEILNS